MSTTALLELAYTPLIQVALCVVIAVVFKQAMKEEFIDMKQKVHAKIEENARIVEDIRQKVLAWKE